MAKLTKAIFGTPDGEVYPREIEAGSDCPPNLEAYAESLEALDDGAIDVARQKAEAEAAAKAQAEAEEAAKASKKTPDNK